MPLLKKRSWLSVRFHHCALFVAERNLQVHFVSEILFQDPCFSSCWCAYYKYSSVCWDLLSAHSPPIRDRGNLDL